MSDELGSLAAKIRRCRRCPLWRGRRRAVPGEGPSSARCMLIGESPGREEDASGRPFVGRSGRFLDLALDRCHLRRDFMFITGSIKCHPPKNRAPNKGELEACKPYLLGQMQVINPPVLVLLGGVASSNLMGIPLNRARGKVVNRSGRLVLTTYHPSAAMRFPALRKPFLDDIATLASLLSGEP